MKVAVIGTGNVGVAIAADLSIKGHDISLIKTSERKPEIYERLSRNDSRIYLKENYNYKETAIKNVSFVMSPITFSLITIASAELGYNFRNYGRTIDRLETGRFIHFPTKDRW